MALVGRPNVGKSTLFNRFVGSHLAITSEEAGTTRDRLERVISLSRTRFLLTDMGGIMPLSGVSLEDDIQAQAQAAIAESDLIIFLVDAKTGITPDDHAVTELLRRSGRPVIFVANKYESGDPSALLEFAQFGLGVPLGVSAVHGSGYDELVSTITKSVRSLRRQGSTSAQVPEEARGAIKLAFIGRPNVGKSSLVNALTGSKRVIVSEVPCTTRDTNDILLTREDTSYHLLDTAGLRRPGRIGRGIDRFATGRTLNTITEADVALLLLDGEQGLIAQDLHIIEKALEAGVGILLVINKTDAWEDYEAEQDRWLRILRRKFAFAPWLPVVMLSARTGRHTDQIFPRITEILAERQRRIPTRELNLFVKRATAEHAPKGGKRVTRPPRIYYATQVDTAPPTFVFFVNSPQSFHFSYRRYLENRLREEYGFFGTPIRIQFRQRPREARRTS